MAEAIIKERKYEWLFLSALGLLIFLLTIPSITIVKTESTTCLEPDNLVGVLIASIALIPLGLSMAFNVNSTYKIVGKKYILKEKKEIEKTEETWEEVKGGN